MVTLSGLMWLSRAALDADQQAIDITSDNVANQNTAGYTRETAVFSASDVVVLNGYSGDGEDVTVKAVSQRDRVLEQQLQQSTQSSSAASARESALNDVQRLFGLSATDTDSSSTTLGTAINSFFASLTTLSANPTDTPTRSAVVSAAATLAAAFNSAAQGINNETATLNAQVATGAKQVNGLTASIAQLNGEITALSPNADAGTLEDQRQQDIKQLSALIGVNQITTESNGVTLTASDGTVLVTGGTAFPLSTTNVAGLTQLVGGKPAAVLSSDLQGGSLGGALQVRDHDLPTVSSALDQLAYAIGSAVNTQNEAGSSPTGSAETAVFQLPASASGAAAAIAVSSSFSADDLATAGTGEGSAGTTNALALANLGSAGLVNGSSAANAFADLIGNLGTAVSGASSASTAASAVLTQAQTQRDSLSAVSLDEEASALTQYQRSYEAAAKVFSVVNQMMTDALNLGEQTSFS